MLKVLFVCLGNICRSPTAHGVFEHALAGSELAGRIEVDSAGTGAWHVGNPPDQRAQAEARCRGVDLSALRARQVRPADFEIYDYILAMDKQNLSDLKAMQPANSISRVELFLSYADSAHLSEVPDPYYGGEDGFREVFDLVEAASAGLLRHLDQRLKQ